MQAERKMTVGSNFSRLLSTWSYCINYSADFNKKKKQKKKNYAVLSEHFTNFIKHGRLIQAIRDCIYVFFVFLLGNSLIQFEILFKRKFKDYDTNWTKLKRTHVAFVRAYLDFHGYHHRDQLLIQFPHHDQLLQSQTAQSAKTMKNRNRGINKFIEFAFAFSFNEFFIYININIFELGPALVSSNNICFQN